MQRKNRKKKLVSICLLMYLYNCVFILPRSIKKNRNLPALENKYDREYSPFFSEEREKSKELFKKKNTVLY